MSLKDCTPERFDELIEEQARKAGVAVILSIPGVWEEVREYFNNAVCELLEEEEEEDEEKEVDNKE